MMIGSIVRDNLRITRELGSGAMGTVYLAEHTVLTDKYYALKVLKAEYTNNPDFQTRFFVEAKNQSRLDHANIVQVIDYFQHDECYCLLLAYVAGKSLHDLIQEKGRLTEKQALGIFSDILQGLDCAHRHGIIHRDVKPSNVMIDRDGRARLTDFGIAVRFGDMRLTRSGGRWGTTEYMSPEQIQTPETIDQRSDVYSAGVVLFEMLTGKLPFDGQTEFAIEEQIVRAPRPNPRALNRDISEPLSRIVLRAMDANPDRRFAGCGAFLKAIRDYRWPAPKKTAVALLALATVVAGSLFVWRWWNPVEVEIEVEVEVPNPTPLVKAATQAFAVLCMHNEQVAIKKRSKLRAEQMAESRLAEQFGTQVSELEANIQDNAALYAHQLKQLTQLMSQDRGRVEDALREPADLAIRERFRQMVADDVGRQVNAGSVPTQAEMLSRCQSSTASSVAGRQ